MESLVPIIQGEDEWNGFNYLAVEQGVGAISFDDIHECYATNPAVVASLDSPANKALKYDWFRVEVSNEIASENFRNTIASLAELHSNAGIKRMLLKGYGLSLGYPIPRHQPVGDIDVCLYGLFTSLNRVVIPCI